MYFTLCDMLRGYLKDLQSFTNKKFKKEQKSNKTVQKYLQIVEMKNKKSYTLYLHISELAHIMSAIMKSRDGVRTPDANSSSSQCMPVYPKGQWHSYIVGGA